MVTENGNVIGEITLGGTVATVALIALVAGVDDRPAWHVRWRGCRRPAAQSLRSWRRPAAWQIRRRAGRRE